MSEAQLSELLKKYDDQTATVSALAAEYAPHISVATFSRHLPHIIHEDAFCPYCPGVHLQSPRSRQSSKTYCPECNHLDQSWYCNCYNCAAARDKEERRKYNIKRDVLRENYPKRVWLGSIDDLTIFDAVYLTALINQSLSEDMNTVDPFLIDKCALGPTAEYTNKIVQHLYAKSLIDIDISNSVGAFEFDKNQSSYALVDVSQSRWLFLPGLSPEEKYSFVENLSNKINGNWPDSWVSESALIWRDIVKWEAIEYMHHLLKERRYNPPKVGNRTNSVFDYIVDKFPISKAYYLINLSVRHVSDRALINNIPSYVARNTFLGEIQSKADKAIAENWDIKGYLRHRYCPQSWVSSTYFNAFVKIGDKAFTTLPPSKG
ncbi:MAG: hypothetical protein ACRYFE_12160 [Janthinobacterium lividum]